jgi:hypothetical protein
MTDQALTALRDELKTLLGSYAYAFAHAAGCSMGASDPRLESTVQRVRDLEAMLAEYS